MEEEALVKAPSSMIGAMAVSIGLAYAYAKRHNLTELSQSLEERHPELKYNCLPRVK